MGAQASAEVRAERQDVQRRNAAQGGSPQPHSEKHVILQAGKPAGLTRGSTLPTWKIIFYTAYVLIPLGAFAAWGALFCAYSHAYSSVLLAWSVLFSLGCFGVAFSRKFPAPEGRFETALLAALVGLATIASIFVGRYIYATYFSSYDEFQGLITYVNIDPAQDKGAAYTDAGEVYFKEGARVDTSRTVAYVAHDVFCLAPIVRDGGATASVMDWFVVGRNCCKPPIGSMFTCHAQAGRSGLRLLDSSVRPMYALAVDEWTSQYDVPADHPLFFEWVVDPHADVIQLRLNGWLFFTYVCEAVLVILIVLVAWCSFWIEEIRNATQDIAPKPPQGYGTASPAEERRLLEQQDDMAFLEGEAEEEVIRQAVFEDQRVAETAAQTPR